MNDLIVSNNLPTKYLSMPDRKFAMLYSVDKHGILDYNYHRKRKYIMNKLLYQKKYCDIYQNNKELYNALYSINKLNFKKKELILTKTIDEENIDVMSHRRFYPEDSDEDIIDALGLKCIKKEIKIIEKIREVHLNICDNIPNNIKDEIIKIIKNNNNNNITLKFNFKKRYNNFYFNHFDNTLSSLKKYIEITKLKSINKINKILNNKKTFIEKIFKLRKHKDEIKLIDDGMIKYINTHIYKNVELDINKTIEFYRNYSHEINFQLLIEKFNEENNTQLKLKEFKLICDKYEIPINKHLKIENFQVPKMFDSNCMYNKNNLLSINKILLSDKLPAILDYFKTSVDITNREKKLLSQYSKLFLWIYSEQMCEDDKNYDDKMNEYVRNLWSELSNKPIEKVISNNNVRFND